MRPIRFAIAITGIVLVVYARPAEAQGNYSPGTEGEIWQQLQTFGPAAPDCTWTSSGLICVRAGGPVCGTVSPDPPMASYTVCGDLPLPEQMAFPIAVAVDQTGTSFVPPGATFVTDQFNNKVRVFRPDGSLLDLPHPIGSVENPLSQPEGIAIDAAHQIVVSDSYNSSVNVYSPDGTLRFRIWIDGVPTGVAVSPGATVTGGDGSSLNAADHAGVVVVTDKYRGLVHVYDANGGWIRTLGGIQSGSGHGSFVSPAGVAFDPTAQHFIVADLDSAWTQIYNADGSKFELQFTSEDGAQRSYAASFDHLGRALVSDTSGQRVIFYSVDFSHKTAGQLFTLDARGNLNGFPRGIAEWSIPDQSRPGFVIDEQLFVVDTTNHRVQRFQLPDLAALDMEISAPVTAGGSGTVTFRVAVPDSKPAVTSVVPSLAASGATVVGPLEPVGITIGTQQTATFTYTYTRTGAQASFAAAAKGNPVDASSDFPDGYATHSNTLEQAETIRCSDCASTAVVRSPAPSPSGWYRGQTFVRLTGSGTATQVLYRFVNCPQAGYTRGVQAVPASGGDAVISTEGRQTLLYWAVDGAGAEGPHHSLEVKVDFSAPYISFAFPQNFTSAPDGSRWYNRNSSPVSVAWGARDALSGMPADFIAPPLVFGAEGRNLSGAVTAADVAGNSITLQSNDPAADNAMAFNIDVTPPALTLPAGDIVIDANTPAGLALGQVPSMSALIPGLVATDPPMSTGAPGSGVASIAIQSGPSVLPLGRDTAVTFAAVDHAGNISTAVTRNVRIVAPGTPRPTISVSAEPSILWPANHRLVDVNAVVAASDSSGVPPTVTLVSIVSSDPDSGIAADDVPHDIQDAAFGTADMSFKLRAEHRDHASSRTYTITYRATNAGGATATGTTTVIVPPANDLPNGHGNGIGKNH